MSRELGDEAHLDTLRLQGRDKGMAGAVGRDGGEAELLDGGSPEALAKIVVDQRSPT